MKLTHTQFILFLILICSFLIGCSVQHQQEQIYSLVKIENEDSNLLPAMLTAENFSSEWHWYSAQLKQVNYIPTASNYGLLEESILHVTAYYKNEDNPITIWQTLSSYQEVVPHVSPDSIEFRTNGQIFPSFDLLVKSSDVTQCIDMGENTTCIALLNFKDISIQLEITAPTRLEKETFQTWLNQFISIILEEL